MHIAIMGPVATKDAARLLDSAGISDLPRGYEGAPLMVTLIEELLRQGHQVSAFTTSSDMPLRAGHVVIARGERFALHYIPARPKAWLPNGWRPGRIHDLFAFERKGLERAVLSAKPDVVHAHWAYEFAWAALTTKIPHVITSHDSPFAIAKMYQDRPMSERAYRWLKAIMAWRVLRGARRVTTVSPYMLGQVQPLCRGAVRVVPNPITEMACASKIGKGAPASARIIMVCNGWDARKNPEAGLRAFAELSRCGLEAELHAFGHGFEPGGVGEKWWQAQKLSGKLEFRGGVSHAQILAEMAQADVLLHPSREESFGAVLAEAMLAGCAVVAGANSGAVPWVVGPGGRLVDIESPTAIADALQVLLTDRVELAWRAEAGFEHVKSVFSPQRVALDYLDEYRLAIENPR